MYEVSGNFRPFSVNKQANTTLYRTAQNAHIPNHRIPRDYHLASRANPNVNIDQESGDKNNGVNQHDQTKFVTQNI
ncbi:hypothetical protein ACE6H2_016908 [Prunus campanulata]